jgi:DNA modification methylase
MPRPRSTAPRNTVANVRLTDKEREEMEAASADLGHGSLSEYIRFLHKHWRDTKPVAPTLKQPRFPTPALYHQTKLGEVYHGDSLGLLHQGLAAESVDLIMTSPPFGLVRKKSYGNEDADEYVRWFRPFAEGFKRVLKKKGSLVIDIGGSWKKGFATRSLYHFELLISLVRDHGFHLCQEHYWWNPAKLPTPAEWVNIRRVRVKDAVNCVWWLSPTPWPRASNRRVLAPYSDSMKDLLINGYTSKLRPSGHHISTKFQKDNGGAVPPNLLAIANTDSNGRYQSYCKAQGIDPHPARFPPGLPEYFIRMLTDRGDTVLDPFAGSCVTGEVSEGLQRKWICSEIDAAFLKGAMCRFEPRPAAKQTPAPVAYEIYPPCSLPLSDSIKLSLVGGERREPGDVSPLKPRKAKVGGKTKEFLQAAE